MPLGGGASFPRLVVRVGCARGAGSRLGCACKGGREPRSPFCKLHPDQMRRFKKLRLTASDCEALRQSPEGTLSLTQPLGQRQGSRNAHQGLYPACRAKKRQRGAGQSRITDYFRTQSRPSGCPADMAKSNKIRAEEPLESLFAHDDFLGPEDSCSLLEDGGDVALAASSKRPCFSQGSHSCQGENGPWDQADQPFLERLAERPLADGNANLEVDVQPGAEDVEIDPLPDACFGLLGTVCWDVPQGQIDQLPDEILHEIFALVPALDLYQSLSLVCRRWQRIISNPQFIPWKKLYHQYLKGEAHVVSFVNTTLNEYDLTQDQMESMLGFIRCLATLMSHRRRDAEAILRCLKSHPLFPLAEIAIAKRLPDLESPESRTPYVWAVMTAIVLFSGGVCDIQELVACLCRPSSTLSLMDIMEALYCMATLLYAMRENEVHVSNRIHYSIFSCLYLIENSNCGTAFRTPELSGSSNKPGMQPTCEQQQILSHAIAPGQVVKIIAFAGTGKTTTLTKYAEKWSDLRFLYLAFNKTVAEQGRRVFSPNVTCRTAHSLAFAEVGKRYAKKLNPGSLTSYCISSALLCREGQSLFIRAKTVAQTLAAFFASADNDIGLEHTPLWCKNNKGEKVLVQADERTIVVEEAKQIWAKMKMLNSTGELAHKMTHDGYLKLWQLQTPLLSSYDVIMVDEAQDCTPAIMSLVLSQPCGVILVGDPHQQIYTFRGAVNALSEVCHSHIFYLTQSFRFGPEIAYVGATILDVCKKVRKKTLVGSNRAGDVSGTDVTGQVAHLSRNNHTVFDDAVTVTGREPSAKIHLLGGLKAFGLEKIHDIWKLFRPELKLEVRDPFIKRWVKQGFEGIKDYAAKAEDKQLEMKIATVEKYRDRIPELIERISRCHVHALENADYVLGTVHKSKGLEFDTVQVSGDLLYIPFEQHFDRGLPKFCTGTVPDDEWNLLYVAVTRAKRRLIMPMCLSRLLTLAGEHYLRPQLMSEGCEEVPLRCSVRACHNSVPAESFMVMKKMPFVYSDGTGDPGGVFCPGCLDRHLGPLAWLTFLPDVLQTMDPTGYIFQAQILDEEEFLVRFQNMVIEETRNMMDRLIGRVDQMTERIMAKVEACTVNAKLKQVEAATEPCTVKLQDQTIKTQQMDLRLIALQDQERRANIRIKFFPEVSAENPRILRGKIMAWIKQLTPDMEWKEEDIERVHRISYRTRGERPRDIVVKFANYYKKEQIMIKTRQMTGQLNYQGIPIQVYNDLCSQTINWRREVKTCTEILIKNGINYSWGYPVFLKFTFQRKFYKITSLVQGMELLKQLGLLAEEGSSLREKKGQGKELGAVGGSQ